MEQFDEMLKAMAKKEEMMVPNGFDERVRETLDGLPPREKRRGLGAVKTVLIAAALCAALLCTAFAASPELRGMLAEALGGFAPYAQGQEGEAYVIDGIEFRVVSALADDFTVRAYVEARELEGDRLSKLERNVLGGAFGLVDVPIKDMGNSEGSGGGTTSGVCLDYDPETKTALLAVTSWGQVMADDLSGAEVKLFSLSGGPKAAYRTIWENSGGVYFPVEIKPMPSLTLDGELASGLGAEEVRISSLGLSVIFKGDGAWRRFAGTNVSVRLSDGTLAEAPWEGGQGNYGAYGTETERKVLVWNFRQPVDVDGIQGIYVGEDYFPLG